MTAATATPTVDLKALPDELPKAGRLVMPEVIDAMLDPATVPEPLRVAAESFARINAEYFPMKRDYPRTRVAASRARMRRDQLESDAAAAGTPVDAKALAKLDAEAAEHDAACVSMVERAQVLRPAYQSTYKALSLAIAEHGEQWIRNIMASHADHEQRLTACAQEVYDIGCEKRSLARIDRFCAFVKYGSGRGEAPEPGIALPIPSSIPGAPLLCRLPGGDVAELGDLCDSITMLRGYRNGFDAAAGPDPRWTYHDLTVAAQEAAGIAPADRLPVAEPD